MIAAFSGVRRNACVALARNRQLVAACEQERVTRSRSVGMASGGLPRDALQLALATAGATPEQVLEFVAAESPIQLPDSRPGRVFDHHWAHAMASFVTSPFEDAAVLVCDRHSSPEVSLWQAADGCLTRVEGAWEGAGFASLYGRLAGALGFAREGQEHEVEALARVRRGNSTGRASRLMHVLDGRLEVNDGFERAIEDWLREDSHQDSPWARAEVAGAVQERVGELLVDLLRAARRQVSSENLGLGGGLFYNTYLNTVVERAGVFRRTFVPVNPGNAGLAPGCALAASGVSSGASAWDETLPFLGPEFTATGIKAVLENCKLSYHYANGEEIVAEAVDALRSGQLVGWFQGRMEWGPRALGNRSILASPLSPYVRENMNRFLKQREPHRTYGVSIPQEELKTYFRGPSVSRFMEYEYDLHDGETFPGLLPAGCSRLRVHSVAEHPVQFRRLLRAFGDQTGVPILLNTSFNSFHEPIVCNPRDAVRVFFSTGLDLLVLGNFILRK